MQKEKGRNRRRDLERTKKGRHEKGGKQKKSREAASGLMERQLNSVSRMNYEMQIANQPH